MKSKTLLMRQINQASNDDEIVIPMQISIKIAILDKPEGELLELLDYEFVALKQSVSEVLRDIINGEAKIYLDKEESNKNKKVYIVLQK